MDVLWPGICHMFRQLPSESEGSLSFKCLLCVPKEKVLKASTSSASNLRTHVKNIHPSKLSEFNECMEKKGRKRRNTEESEGNPSKQVTLQAAFTGLEGPKKLPSGKEQHDAVLNFVIGTGSPFSIVEHTTFKRLVEVYQGRNAPKYCPPPNRKQLMENLRSSFIEMTSNLKDTLKTVSAVCTTADCWTVFKRSYLGMTVHWIDPTSLERQSKGLSCRRIQGQHTFDVLADAIEGVLEEFEIKEKTVMMVTDNGSNFVKAFRLFSSDLEDSNVGGASGEGHEADQLESIDEVGPILEDSDEFGRLPPHHRCTAHTLNLLASRDAEEANKHFAYRRISKQVFSKCQTLFNKQNKSTISAEIVKKTLGRYLLVPGATRWNSHFDAVALIKENEEKMDEICRALDVQPFKRPIEVKFIAEYCKVMEPVASALDILQGDQGVHMGFLLPTLSVVKQSISSLQDLEFCEPLKTALLAGFEKRFSHLFDDKDLRLAAYLVPRFKLDWLPVGDQLSSRNELEDEVRKHVAKSITNKSSNNQAVPRTEGRGQMSKIDKFFSKMKTQTTNENMNQTISIADAEIMGYFHNTSSENELSPLMKSIFIKYNTPIPSSAHCERMFSTAGHLFSDKRGRMTDENFERRMLLKFNNCF